MPIYRFGSRYSRWDGTQQISALDADELMRAMSEDLMQNGDLNLALQRLFRWGVDRQDGDRVPGLREMLQRLKEQRQQQLNRYDLGSVMDDIQERLRQVLETERAGIDRRLDEGRQQVAAQQAPPTAAPENTGDPAGPAANRANQGNQVRRVKQVKPTQRSRAPGKVATAKTCSGCWNKSRHAKRSSWTTCRPIPAARSAASTSMSSWTPKRAASSKNSWRCSSSR